MVLFENSRRYSQFKVDHRCQRHRRQILPPVSLGLLIICHRSTILVANLPPVSTTPVANSHQYQRHQQQICHRFQRHRWQTMGLISGCRYLKVNLKAKIYIYVNSTIQRCPNKIIKIFLTEDFFMFSFHFIFNLELRISPRIFFKKFETVLMGYSMSGWKLIHEKNQKKKIL